MMGRLDGLSVTDQEQAAPGPEMTSDCRPKHKGSAFKVHPAKPRGKRGEGEGETKAKHGRRERKVNVLIK